MIQKASLEILIFYSYTWRSEKLIIDLETLFRYRGIRLLFGPPSALRQGRVLAFPSAGPPSLIAGRLRCASSLNPMCLESIALTLLRSAVVRWAFHDPASGQGDESRDGGSRRSSDRRQPGCRGRVDEREEEDTHPRHRTRARRHEHRLACCDALIKRRQASSGHASPLRKVRHQQ